MVISLNPIRSLRLVCLLLFLLVPFFQVGADEIRFKDGDILKKGIVIDEDDVSITIRFPKESIESVERSSDRTPSPSRDEGFQDQDGGYIIPESPGEIDTASPFPERGLEEDEVSQKSFTDLKKRVGELERKLESFSKEKGPSGQVLAEKGTLVYPLVERELGSIEGFIFWKEEPLVNSDVMVVMTKYLGSYLDAHKKMFMEEEDDMKSKRIALSTRTDNRGKYFFEKVPPGEYILYWKPDKETGWVRRFREGADFSVLPGELTVQNIPGDKNK